MSSGPPKWPFSVGHVRPGRAQRAGAGPRRGSAGGARALLLWGVLEAKMEDLHAAPSRQARSASTTQVWRIVRDSQYGARAFSPTIVRPPRPGGRRLSPD